MVERAILFNINSYNKVQELTGTDKSIGKASIAKNKVQTTSVNVNWWFPVILYFFLSVYVKKCKTIVYGQ